MANSILDHLNDLEFYREMTYLEETMGKALNAVLDSWVERGVIKSDDKSKVLEEWDENKYTLFSDTLG